MVRLNFVVDKTYVLQRFLKSFSQVREHKELKRLVWEKNKNVYYLLSQNIEPLVFGNNFPLTLHNAMRNVENNLLSIFHSKIFKKLELETQKYAEFVKMQWKKNYARSLSIMDEITKLDISKKNIKLNVYISHPKLWNGRSYPENSAITWGHNEDWKNYSIVYLWHEIMHHITYKTKADQNVLHALIELACDNELRIRLNGRGGYFQEKEFAVGHKRLLELEKKIEPMWLKYLHNKKINIVQFEKWLKRKLPKKFLEQQTELDRWAEWN